jgi:hypothetical protein
VHIASLAITHSRQAAFLPPLEGVGGTPFFCDKSRKIFCEALRLICKDILHIFNKPSEKL